VQTTRLLLLTRLQRANFLEEDPERGRTEEEGRTQTNTYSWVQSRHVLVQIQALRVVRYTHYHSMLGLQ
jgi:hypothetical protein